MNKTAIRISPDIRLRKEYFGGLVYDRRNGNILEIDKEAFQMLSLMKDKTMIPDELSALLVQNKIIKKPVDRIDNILRELIELEVVEQNDRPPSYPWIDVKEPTVDKPRSWLTAPETVHWAVTYSCAENCPDCYTQRFSIPESELDTDNALRLIDAVQNTGIIPGANLILTKSSIKQLPGLVNKLVLIGFRRVVLLRYKPPAGIKRWEAERLTSQQLRQLHVNINNIVQQNPGLSVRVDCALSFVQRNLPPELAARLGIKGCVAADRILAVSPDGSAYPCSQLVHPQCYAGNLLETEPQLLWNKSDKIRRYRSFRTKNTFTHSWCSVCLKKTGCGGCRVFASDGIGGEPECPQPMLPPITELGNIGRGLDLAEYIKDCGSISAGEYMERYGVGQKTALKELNASLDAVSVSGETARKKKEQFISQYEDTIFDIQDSISHTLWGFPYATQEQIEEWIKEPDYPAWIKERDISPLSELENSQKGKHGKKKKRRKKRK